ncbi:MAG: hydrogenase formation protein HypD [Acidobacteriota bacterium]
MLENLRNKKLIKYYLKEISKKTEKIKYPLKIMEVCGTHTVVIYKYGLRKILKDLSIDMISGPGCPVCVTPNEIIESAISILERENFILATFGDMTRVPTRKGSMQDFSPEKGSIKKIIYSPEEAIELSEKYPKKEVVFFGVGFETTIPSIGWTVKKAKEKNLKNFSALTALWLIPPPLKALVSSDEIRISGFLYPGHVSAIIGTEPYRFIPEEYHIPGAITGFEPCDVLMGIDSILTQIIKNRPSVDIQYKRVVRKNGNEKAKKLMGEMFEEKDTIWRGLGLIKRSGLRLKSLYSDFDAEKRFNINIKLSSADLPGCKCGEVIKGIISPEECPLFSKICNPDSPKGPCMVSYEGACLSSYKYRKTMLSKG